MKSMWRIGPLFVLVGCHAGAVFSPGTSCDDRSPCRPPLVCVQGSCAIADGGAANADSTNDAISEAARAAPDDTRADTHDAGEGRDTVSDIGDAPGMGDATDAADADAGDPGDVGETRDASDAGDLGDASTPPPPPPGKCDDTAVSACAVPPGHPGCDQIFCGERLWENGQGAFNGVITYRIDDPKGQLSEGYKNAIRSVAQAWSQAVDGVVTFRECSPCVGRVIVIVPGTGDGIVDPAQYEEVLPMPVPTGSLFPLHQIAHQWGHAIGLGHTYERADRDRYVRFDPAVWCGPDRSGLPPHCAFGPDQPGVPPIASDTFGVYDETSKMNGLAIDGICGTSEPDASSGLPTAGDASAVQELYQAHAGGWAPFQPIARSISPTQPLDYQLAPGVDPVGTPAVTVATPPAVEIFVRGNDRGVYAVHNVLRPTFVQWSSWELVATDVDGDPAAVLADQATLYLAVRAKADGSIRLRSRTNGAWSTWATLGAPAVGTGSGPAIAIQDGTLSVLVLGKDGYVHALACTDPQALCAASAGHVDAWRALPALPSRQIRSRPSVGFRADGRLVVAATADDDTAWQFNADGAQLQNGAWLPISSIDLMPGDPDPGVTVQIYGNDVGLYARGARGILVESAPWGRVDLGGVISAAPGAMAAITGEPWVDIAAVIDDHQHPGVWLKFYGGFQAVCNYNAPGTCGQCGCNLPNKPACAL
jgi:hypothetical protein